MKFTLAALALAAVARAQTRDDIPSCALTCLDDAITSETSCSTTDYTCVCANFDSLQGAATTCVIKACGSDVAINDVLPAVQALCAAVSSGAGASTAAATSNAAATSSSAAVETTAAPATSAAPTTVEKSTKAAETSEAAAATTTPAGNATTPGTSSPSETVVTTAGAATLSSIGGIAMLIFAALAL